MNKFAIKQLNNHSTELSTESNPVEKLSNKHEFNNQTSEENSIYDQIHLTVSDSGTIRLNDKLPKIEYLLYLLFDLQGEDKFLDVIFADPTQEYLNRVKSKLEINDTTREIVRKNIHYSLYHHLLTYDYKTLQSISMKISEN